MHSMENLVWLPVTLLIYMGSRRLYRRYPLVLFSPILLGTALLIAVLAWTGTSYGDYMATSRWVGELLGPATVAFAVPLYKHFDVIQKHAKELLLGVSLGSLVSIVASVLLAKWLDLGRAAISAVSLHSVTTPIAMEVAKVVGAAPSLTAVFVVLTGILGAATGPLVIRWLRIDSPVAKGSLMGTSAHGVGTARALEMGQVEGTVSMLAMIIAGCITTLVMAVVGPFLFA